MKITYQSDEVLIQGLQNGSRQALEFIYSAHWPMIANFVRLNNGSPEEAEDLYQEGIITLYEQVRKGKFQVSSSIRTYLYAICRNKWLSKLKKQVPISDLEEQLQQIPAEEASPDIPSVDEAVLKLALEELGEPCRSIIVGYYYHELSLDQLAENLKYSNANVAKQQKFRCVERLKKKFFPHQSKINKMMPEYEEHFNTEWIEQYLSGELKEEELEKFTHRLRTDGAFRQEVAVQRAIVNQAQQIGREEMQQDLKSLHRELGFTKKEAKTISFNFYAIAASIILLLAATVVFYFYNQSTEKMSAVAQVRKSLTIPFQVTGQDPAIGFSGTYTDSTTTILLYPAGSPAYQFNDTLRLYGNFAANQLTLQYDQAKEQYTLIIDSLSYTLQRYRPKQALTRAP